MFFGPHGLSPTCDDLNAVELPKSTRRETKESIAREDVFSEDERREKAERSLPASEECALHGVFPDGLSHMEHTQAEEIKVGASIHLTFEQLEPRDLSLDLPSTPGFGEGGLNC